MFLMMLVLGFGRERFILTDFKIHFAAVGRKDMDSDQSLKLSLNAFSSLPICRPLRVEKLDIELGITEKLPVFHKMEYEANQPNKTSLG